MSPPLEGRRGRIRAFLLIVLGVWTLMHLYVVSRVWNLPAAPAAGWHVGLTVAAVTLWLGMTNHPVDQALERRPAGATIFLSHSPWSVERAAQFGVGLMLSGHTHAGQIWPFTYVVRTMYPYVVGRYDVKGMTLVVSRGTGFWGPPMRLFRRREITVVTLRSR